MNKEKYFCPECESENITRAIHMGGVGPFKCQNCGYEAQTFPTKEKVKKSRKNER